MTVLLSISQPIARAARHHICFATFCVSSGGGIYVDMANIKEVNGKQYREPGGKCPVFGKNIEFFQPLNDPNYKNDFLDYVPTKTQSDATGPPLPGGFNSNFKLKDGSAFSPISAAKLRSYPQCELVNLGPCYLCSGTLLHVPYYKTTALLNIVPFACLYGREHER